MSNVPEVLPPPPDRRCYRHNDRRGGVRCQRCERPICPECMRQASVGFHCPACAAPRRSPATARAAQRASAVRRVYVTWILLALNGLAFLYSVVLNRSGGGFTRINRDLLIDGGLFAGASLIEGARFRLIGVDAGEYYRLVTSAFLHDGIIHLALNMYILWFLGQMLESGFGRARFSTLFVVSMLGGAFGVLVLSPPNVPTVGASGAVFGLMGATVLVLRRETGSIWRTPLTPLLLINVVFTLLIPRVSIGGHFGGLAAGMVMGAVIIAMQRRRLPAWLAVLTGGAISALLVAGSLAAAAR
ncbi:MAG: rhomboid family intramembrane serine protease [Acidimicrobiaceae bacterium]|nr:rhomboid family intramembrane serine protease [Acidimicrobiaceae bacterium]